MGAKLPDASVNYFPLIQKGVGYAEAKQTGDLMDLTKDGFVANPGNQDARAVKAILFSAFYWSCIPFSDKDG